MIVYEGEEKVVMYGQPGPPPLSVGGLRFAIRMDDFVPDYENVQLSQSLQDEADLTVSSLALIESEAAATDGAAEYDYAGWLP